MATAKLFQHGGSQAVRLPKAFRFAGKAVGIEKRGEEVILRPMARPSFKTLGDVASYLAQKYPDTGGFPAIERPTEQQKRDLTW